MSLEFEVPLFSLIFIIMLCIIYFSKKNVKLLENKYFEIILCASFLEILIDTVIHFICAMNDFNTIISRYYILFNYLNKILIILFLIIFGSFFIYILIISYDKVKKKIGLYRNTFIFIVIIYSLCSLFTNIELVQVGNVTNVSGSTIILGYISIAIMLILSLIVTLLNISKIDKRYIAIFLILLLLGLLYALTILFPGMIIYDLVLVLLCYIMYFTIENPDMKMLKEIQQSKEFAEQANNEKAMFLYNMSQEIKLPVKSIEEKCEEIMFSYELSDELREEIREVKFAAKKLSGTINGTLDMSKTQASNIEIKVSKYNSKVLFKELVSISRVNMKDKNLEFRINIDDAIPEYLMGDSIRIKQIITTIMNNAIKHTEKGFIEFNVSSVIKHDMCRLIMTIEDSGKGIESHKLETLFYNTDEEENENLDNTKVDDTRESLSVIKILTNLIGGTVIVNSELGKGSKFTVVLDQEIVEEKTNTMVAIEKLSSNKRILVVDDEEESLKQIVKLLNKYDVNVDTVMWGQECLEKIRKQQKYDLILIDEDMPRLNGIKTFEKLKLEDNFNIPVVIMIDDKHFEYKERYLYNGFSGCIVKPIKKQELDKILKKHLKLDE